MTAVIGIRVWVVYAILLETIIHVSVVQTFDNNCLRQFESDLKTETYCGYGVNECSYATLQKRFPGMYNKSAWRAPAPSTVTPKAICSEDRETSTSDTATNKPAIQVVWKLPEDSGASLIHGFDIRIEGNRRGYRCIVIKLLDKITSSGTSFKGTIYPLEQRTKVMLTLQSLPRNDSRGTVEKDVTTPKCVSNPSGSWFVKQFNITYNFESRQLYVAFKDPPQEFGFQQFTLTLETTDFSRTTQVRINQTQHTFQDVEPREYSILLLPYDPFLQQENRCKCRDIRDVCSSCTMSKTRYVAKTKLKETRDTSQSKLKYIIIGSVGGVIALFGFGLLLCGFVYGKWIFSCSLKTDQPRDEKGQHDDDSSGRLFVFIDTSDCSERCNGKYAMCNKVPAIENYKTRLLADIGGLAEREIFLMNDKLDQRLLEVVRKWSRTVGNMCLQPHDNCLAGSKVDKSRDNIAGKTSPQTYNVICCFVICPNSSPETLNKVRQFGRSTSFDKNLKVFKVALSFNGKTRALPSFCGELNSFVIPEDHSKMVDFIEKECKNERDVFLPCKVCSSPQNKEKDTCELVIDAAQFSSKYCQDKPLLTAGTPKCDLHIGMKSSLEIPRGNRERFVSNDSGQGGSIESCRYSTLEEGTDSRESSDEYENDFLLSDCCTRHEPIIPSFAISGEDDALLCPSNVYFAPPDPSEVSESDILERYRQQYPSVPTEYIRMSSRKQNGVVNTCPCNLKGGKYDAERTGTLSLARDDSSMDMIMSKMVEINRKSLYMFDADAKVGETYSLFEGNV